MKSLAVDKDRKLSIVELPIPKIEEYQALVQMEACGVCNGTDLKLAHGTFKNFSTYPVLLGHEGVGRVIEVGKKVTCYKPGDRVLLPFLEEKSGEYYPGWGGYSEYALVGDKSLVQKEAYFAQQVIPEGLSSVSASMIVTFREVLSAMKRFGLKENRSIVIFGVGPVGSTFIRFSKLLGLSPVIAVDISEEKVKEALNMGADYAFNSRQVPIVEAVRKILPEGADYTVDAAGVNDIINLSMELIKYNGQICCYGISANLKMELDWSKAPYNWSLNFVQWPLKNEEADAHSQVMNWIELGVLNPDDFISDIVPFDDILTAFKMVEERSAKKKIVIKY